MIKPQITIGIPVYNGERYIKQAVTSVLNQTFKDFELIVTDDGSKDNTLNILKSIQDSRLKIITDGTNRGIAYRLNQQIDLARSDIFVRMDADDVMFPYRLEKQLDLLTQRPDVDVTGASAIVIGENNELLGKRVAGNKEYPSANDYFVTARFIHPTVAGRTEWFRKWRYSDQMSGNEDLDLWIRSHKESVFYNINEPLLFYRDPYKFRLKTYLFRQRRYWKCAWKLRRYMKTPLFFLSCVGRGLASSALAILLTVIGKEEWMIARRNIPLTETEKDKYESIIKALNI